MRRLANNHNTFGLLQFKR